MQGVSTLVLETLKNPKKPFYSFDPRMHLIADELGATESATLSAAKTSSSFSFLL